MIKKFISLSSILFVGKAFSVVSSILLAKALSVDSYGSYAYSISIITMFSVLSASSLGQISIREISKNVANINKFKAWVIRTSLILIFLLIAFYCIMSASGLIKVDWWQGYIFFIIAFIIIVRSVVIIQSGWLNGLNFIKLSQITIRLAIPLALLITSVLLITGLFNFSEFGLLSVHSLVYCVSALIGYFLLKKKLCDSNTEANCIDSASYRSDLNKALIPMTLITVVSVFNSEMVTLILGYVGNFEDVALFKLASQIVLFMAMSQTAMNAVIMPALGRLMSKEKSNTDAIQKLTTKAVRVNSLFGVVFFVLFGLCGEWVINLIFSDKFEMLYALAIVILIPQLFSIMCGPVNSIAMMLGGERVILLSSSLSIACNILVLVSCYERFGIYSAAISTGVAYFVLNSSLVCYLYRCHGLKTWIK